MERMSTWWSIIVAVLHCLAQYDIAVVATAWSDEKSFTSSLSESPLCPHFCVCLDGLYLCQKGGFTSLPTQLPDDTSKIILWHHQFHHSILYRSNLSNYQPPQYRITRLFIRNCTLRHIQTNAFLDLSLYLRELDISHNHISGIEPYTFNGLSLDILRLDGNRNLFINEKSFEGLSQVSTLSMSHCNLKRLNLEVLQPLRMNLENLDLSNNLLTTLGSEFEGVVRTLETIELHNNPFHCDCHIYWLADVFLWRRDFHRQHLQFDSGNFNETGCHSPDNLLQIPLHRLVEEEKLHCKKLALRKVDIDLNSWEDIKITCKVEGSPDIHLRWYQSSFDGMPQSQLYELPSETTTVNEFHSSTVFFNKTLLIGSNQSTMLRCHAQDISSNATVNVRLQWPLKNKSHADRMEEGLISASVTFEKKFNLFELATAILLTFVGTTVLFFLQKGALHRSRKRFFGTGCVTATAPLQGSHPCCQPLKEYRDNVSDETHCLNPMCTSFQPMSMNEGKSSFVPNFQMNSSSSPIQPEYFIDFKTQQRFC